MDLEHLHPEINHLGDYGINHGKYETNNDHCDDLHNDVPQNRDNQKEIIIHCLVWSTRKMLVHNWKLTGTYYLMKFGLTLSWRKPISYRNQPINLLCKSIDWFLYDIVLHHERVKVIRTVLHQCDFNSLENDVCFVLKNLKNLNYQEFTSTTLNYFLNQKQENTLWASWAR